MITLHLSSLWLDGHLSGGGDGRPGEQPGVTEREASGRGGFHFSPLAALVIVTLLKLHPLD